MNRVSHSGCGNDKLSEKLDCVFGLSLKRFVGVGFLMRDDLQLDALRFAEEPLWFDPESAVVYRLHGDGSFCCSLFDEGSVIPPVSRTLASREKGRIRSARTAQRARRPKATAPKRGPSNGPPSFHNRRFP